MSTGGTTDEDSSGTIDGGEVSTGTDSGSTGSGSEDGSTGSTGGSEDSSTGDVSIACPAGDFGGTLPSSFEANTAGQDSEFNGPCGPGGAPDISYTFTAPATGGYIFDTFGSSVDTVMYILDGACGGPALSCNDNGFGSGNASLINVDLEQGQTVTVVVDGFSVFGGAVRVTAREASLECPNGSLGPVPGEVSDNTAVANNEFTGSCGGATSNDQAYLFTAPTDGLYTFDTLASDYNTVLYLLDGSCGGPELACNDNVSGGVTSGLSLQLDEGQTVTAVVDGQFGGFGTFELHVGQLDGTCPDDDLGNMEPLDVSGTTVGSGNAGGAACGGLFDSDHSYTWTAPATATYLFSTEGSDFDTVLHLRDGNCDGAEIGCNNDVSFADTWSRVALPLNAGQTVVVTVDGNGDSGNFDLHIEETEFDGNCCENHPTPGCDVPAIEACVCANDSFCCSNSWDGLCVSGAVNNCGATCL
jgi:hypothetical protein